MTDALWGVIDPIDLSDSDERFALARERVRQRESGEKNTTEGWDRQTDRQTDR